MTELLDFLPGVELVHGFNRPEELFVWSQHEFELRFAGQGAVVVMLCNSASPTGVLTAHDTVGRVLTFELTKGENWLVFRLRDEHARNLRCDVSPKIQYPSDIRELGVMVRHAKFFAARELATVWAAAHGYRLVEGRAANITEAVPTARFNVSDILYERALRNGLQGGWFKCVWMDIGKVDAATLTAVFFPPTKFGTVAPSRFELNARGDVDVKATFGKPTKAPPFGGMPDGFLSAEMPICTAPKTMADAKFDIVVRDTWLNEDILPWQSYSWRGHGVGGLPGTEEIRRVTGPVGLSRFALGGATVYSKVERISTRYLGKSLDQLTRILDWGCGCARVIRFAPERVRRKIIGIDIDRHNVDWCRANYDDVEVLAIEPDPPTPFEDAKFDLIYGQSVFTHLTEDSQFEWLSEHRRLLKPRGICAVTIASELGWSVMLQEQRDSYQYADYLNRGIRDSGWLDIGVDHAKPGYYRNTWHTTDYVVRRWSEYFDILDIIEGCADFQTMVVMRRR